MRHLTSLIILMMAVLTMVSTVSAAGTTGSTVLLGLPVSGASVDVDVAVVTTKPVVPYAYAIQNECNFSGKLNGRPDSYQHDEITSWPSSVGDVPHAVMPVHLHQVPAGSACKVFLKEGNQVVKGSLTTYTVQ